MAQTSTERRIGPRARMRVVHRHRIGAHLLRRVSELVYVRGQPNVVLEWVNLAGVRAPLYMALDPERLHAPRRPRHFFTYDGETSDPRFDDYD
jgi:hypothetical protein